MNVSEERTKSLWMETEVAPDAAPLDSNTTADTVVIGSGGPAVFYYNGGAASFGTGSPGRRIVTPV